MKRFSLLVGASLSAACASPASAPSRARSAEAPAATRSPEVSTAAPPYRRDTPDAPFRATAPTLPPAPAFELPPVRSFRLSCGARVLFLERHSPALLEVEVVVRTGATAPAAEMMSARALWRGTSKHEEAPLAAARDAELARSQTWAMWGTMGAGITTLSDRAQTAIDLLAEVVTTPTFPAPAVLRANVNEMHDREARDDVPATVAERILPMALYGWDRPRDEPGFLAAADVGALTRDDIARAYEAFEPSAATIVVVGDTTQAAVQAMLERAFGAWKNRAPRPPPKAAAAPSVRGGPRLVVVDRPHSPQSYVLFGGPGPALGSQDWVPSLFLREMFVGAGAGATHELRDAQHLAWNPVMRLDASPLGPRVLWSAEVPAKRTAEAMLQVDRAMRSMKAAEVPAGELEETRQRLVRAWPGWLTTLEQESEMLRSVVVHDLPIDEPVRAVARIREVTAADVHRTAESYLDPDRMKVVIVGDWSSIRAQVLALGWGNVELRNAAGAIVGVEPAGSP